MFRVVTVKADGKRGRPVYVSLSTTQTQQSHVRDEGRGILLTIGGGHHCDVTLAGVAYTQEVVLRLIKPPTSDDVENGNGPLRRRFMPPRNDDEEVACAAASDGVIMVVEDQSESRYVHHGLIIENGMQVAPEERLSSIRVVGYGKLLEGSERILRINSGISVKDLMEIIHYKLNLPIELQRLQFAGRFMDDPFELLADCGVKNNSTILLMVASTSHRGELPAPSPTYRPMSGERIHRCGDKERFILSNLSLPSNDDVSPARSDQSLLAVATKATTDELSTRIGFSPVSTDKVCSMKDCSSFVEISRIPLNLCPSGPSSSEINDLSGLGSSVGTMLADSAIGINSTPFHPLLGRTHLLLTPGLFGTKGGTARILSAWCLNLPIVLPDTLAALQEPNDTDDPRVFFARRSESIRKYIPYSMALIEEEEGGGPCRGRRDPLKGFLFISLKPTETEGLVLAAGATVFRSYLLEDTEFYGSAWLDELQSAHKNAIQKESIKMLRNKPRMGGAVAYIALSSFGSQSLERRQVFLAEERLVPGVQPSAISEAILEMNGTVLSTTGARIVGRKETLSSIFRLEWVASRLSIDELPTDPLRLIFDSFLGGPSKNVVQLVRLASTSKSLQRCVYQNASFLWQTIDFTLVHEKYRKRLRDKQLAVLLRRSNCDAFVTERLILFGCRGLDGSGIAPLAGSTILEELDLRFCGGKHTERDVIPDANTIGSVLLSMPPFVAKRYDDAVAKFEGPGVKTIRMDSYDLSNTIRMRKVRLESLQKMISLSDCLGCSLARDAHCCDCEKSLKLCLDTSNGEDNSALESLSRRARESVCFSCKDVVCGRNEQCRSIICCGDCQKQECTECTSMQTCRSCQDQYCCRAMRSCPECRNVQCVVCHSEAPEGVATRRCAECEDIRCTMCRPYDQCTQCKKQFCAGQHDVRLCDCCEGRYCLGCRDMEFCGGCQFLFCEPCGDDEVRECGKCDVSRCMECMATLCDECSKWFCVACAENESEAIMSECCVCDEEVCKDCSVMCSSEECGNMLCGCCSREASSCGVCKKAFCPDCAEEKCPNYGCDVMICDDCESSGFCSCCNLDYCCLCKMNNRYLACSGCHEESSCMKIACVEATWDFFCSHCDKVYCKNCRREDDPIFRAGFCAPDGKSHLGETSWCDMMDTRINRRLDRIYKRPDFYLKSEHKHHLYSKVERAKALSFDEKMEHERTLVKFVEKKHSELGESLLDIDPPCVQPRIKGVFKKKEKPNSAATPNATAYSFDP